MQGANFHNQNNCYISLQQLYPQAQQYVDPDAQNQFQNALAQPEKYSEKILFIKQLGFSDIKKIIKALNRCQGNLQEAIIKLQKKQNKKSKQNIEELVTQSGYHQQMQFLMQNGFNKIKKNFKILSKFNGDQGQALKYLQEKELKKNQRQIQKVNVISKCIFKWNQSIKIQVLDCNNMLFVDKLIRNMCIQKQKIQAQQAIILLAKQLGICLNCNQCKLIFDFTNLVQSSKLQNLDFEVISAKPNFQNSDDLIVSMCTNTPHDLQNSIVYITSDVELEQRLLNAGAQILMKSGAWFNIAEEYLTRKSYEIIIGSAKNSVQ